MGVVYEGRHPLIGKRVAVKVLLPAFSKEKELVARFLSEARAVNEIRHRGIVDIFSFGELPDGTHYLVMEFLQGEAFDQLLGRKGCLQVGEALRLIDEVLDALEAAHAAGIIHRDIKPSNLFLVDTGRGRPYVKLLDFGIAKLGALEGGTTPQTRSSIIVGTPDYLSPEQARGKEISARSDLYSLGVVLFELVTGRRPFKGDNSLQTMWMHIEDEPPRPSSLNPAVPPELDELVLWAMQKRQEDRPANAALMREHVNALRATLMADAPATPGSDRLPAARTPAPSSKGLPRPATPAPTGPRQPVSTRELAAPERTKLTPLTLLERPPAPAAPHPEAEPTRTELPDEPSLEQSAQPQEEPEETVQAAKRSKVPLALGAAVALLALGAFAIGLSGGPGDEQTPAEPSEPARKVALAPAKPAPVPQLQTQAPVAPPKPVEAPDNPPAPTEPPKVAAPQQPRQTRVARGISKAQLSARLVKLEAALSAREAKRKEPDAVLRQFIAQAKKELAAASTERKLREVSTLLDELSEQLAP